MLQKQIKAFLIIGSCAALVNFLLVWGLVHWVDLHPLEANVIGFLVAFNVSYFGHRAYTFRQTQTRHRFAAPAFFVNACIGLVMSEVIYFALLQWGLMYLLALILTMMIVAVYTFVMSKLVVFKV